jgi:hypothetical protein
MFDNKFKKKTKGQKKKFVRKKVCKVSLKFQASTTKM